MSEFDEMMRSNRRNNTKLKKICAPLFQNFGFNSIFYHYISNSGYGTSFGSHVEGFEYYFHNHLYRYNPYVRHPDYFQSGFHLIS